jgi:hypothetical protein
MLVAGAGRDAAPIARHIAKERAAQLDATPEDVVLATAS